MIPDSAYGISLLCLNQMGPARMEKICQATHSKHVEIYSPKSVPISPSTFSQTAFQSAWEFILNQPPAEIAQITKVRLDLAQSWKQEARELNPAEIYERHKDLEILVRGRDGYPPNLDGDPDPPAILFAKGASSLSEVLSSRLAVGIVGTRNCSRYGADISYELGKELASAGVVVISGLAYGIDSAAHSGSTAAKNQANHNLNEQAKNVASSLGVIASGLDVVYPPKSKSLYEAVKKDGVIVSETPLGFVPTKWRFPARNRIIAGLCDLLIVVESHTKGGSLITAEEAGIRGKPVMAVPGSIRSGPSSGTNALIADGCEPITDISDVFTALGFLGEGFLKSDSAEYVFKRSTSENNSQKNSENVPKNNSQKNSAIMEQNNSQKNSENVAKNNSQKNSANVAQNNSKHPIDEAHPPNEKQLLDAFCWEPKDMEALISTSGLDFEKASLALENLIQQGFVVRRGLHFERTSNKLRE